MTSGGSRRKFTAWRINRDFLRMSPRGRSRSISIFLHPPNTPSKIQLVSLDFASCCQFCNVPSTGITSWREVTEGPCPHTEPVCGGIPVEYALRLEPADAGDDLTATAKSFLVSNEKPSRTESC